MIPYDDIAGYIRRQIPDDKRREVEAWINHSPENRRLFERLSDEWKHIADAPELSARPDREKIWNAIRTHIHPSHPAGAYTRKSLVRTVCTAALTACAIGAVAAFFVKSALDAAFMARSVTTVQTASGRKAQLTLPDGTDVWLNSDSRLRYAADFNAAHRIVDLEGEAFFSVAQNPRKKFIVRTEQIDITAKGTSFDVSAYPDDAHTSVSLLEGRVTVSGRDGTTIAELRPNQLVVIPRGSTQCTLYQDDADTFRAWMHDQLVFYDADIFLITRKLERWYGVGITLVDPDPQRRYTFPVKTESLREMLELFDRLTPIDYDINGKEVRITFVKP